MFRCSGPCPESLGHEHALLPVKRVCLAGLCVPISSSCSSPATKRTRHDRVEKQETNYLPSDASPDRNGPLPTSEKNGPTIYSQQKHMRSVMSPTNKRLPVTRMTNSVRHEEHTGVREHKWCGGKDTSNSNRSMRARCRCAAMVPLWAIPLPSNLPGR